MKRIKFVVFDFDGVFTDGRFLFKENCVMKSYNAKDSWALNILKDNGIYTGIITNDTIVSIEHAPHIFNRLTRCSIGEGKPKSYILNQWLNELNLSLSEVAYIGDDLPDICALKIVGFPGCPNDAIKEVKEICKYICKNNGGSGAVREFVEEILTHNLNVSNSNSHQNSTTKKDGKITAVIPVRSGSTRCKNKNIRPFADSNLLKEKILLLKKVEQIDEILVSSNCDEMLQIARDLGVSAHKRDAYHSSGECSGSDLYVNLAQQIKTEYFLFTTCVAPFTDVKEYENACSIIKDIDETKYNSVVSFTPLKTFVWNSQGPLNYNLYNTPKSQDLEEYYVPNYSICLRKTKEIINHRSVIGDRPYMIFSDAITGIDIDHNHEFIISELLREKSIFSENDADYIMKRRDIQNQKMMMLDCTLRDGGYLNNWEFTFEEVVEVYKLVSESKYDYFEIGFRADRNIDSLKSKGRWCFSSELDINLVKSAYPSGCKIAIMCIVGQNDVGKFVPQKESNVHLVRLLLMRKKEGNPKKQSEGLFFDEESVQNAYNDAVLLLEKGYEVTINIAYADIITDFEINIIAKGFSDILSSLKAFYIADTYGGMTSENIPAIVKRFQDSFDRHSEEENPIINFGIHLHNNNLNGFEKYKISKFLGISMCDTSISGLGRGAGNFKMEEYVLHNLQNYSTEHIINLLKLGERMSLLQGESSYKKYIFYYIAGILSLHPDFIHDILGQNLSIDEGYVLIMQIDEFTKKNKSRNYDGKLVDILQQKN